MNEKEIIQGREAIWIMEELAGPILPLIPEAYKQIGQEGPKFFYQWLSIALTVNESIPGIPLKMLLPFSIEKIFIEIESQLKHTSKSIYNDIN